MNHYKSMRDHFYLLKFTLNRTPEQDKRYRQLAKDLGKEIK